MKNKNSVVIIKTLTLPTQVSVIGWCDQKMKEKLDTRAFNNQTSF